MAYAWALSVKHEMSRYYVPNSTSQPVVQRTLMLIRAHLFQLSRIWYPCALHCYLYSSPVENALVEALGHRTETGVIAKMYLSCP